MIAELRPYDVSRSRAARLRRQCHARLQAQARGNVAGPQPGAVRRVVGPALAGAWCLAYLLEIVRRAAAVYGF